MSDTIKDMSGVNGSKEQDLIDDKGFIMSLITSKLFIFNILFAYLWLWFAKRAIRPLIQKTKEDVDRDQKYDAFARKDLGKLTKSWTFYIWAPTMFLRFAIAYGSIIIMCVISWFLSLCKSKGTFHSGITHSIVRFTQMMSAGTVLSCGGILPWNFKIVNKHVCYKKYLGPDWTPSKKQPTGIICNHQSWIDIMVNMFQQSPSHVAKEATKRIPFVGKCAEMYGCLFLQRDSKDQKRDMFTQISERQEDIDKGLYPPLIFYAEGGTSNGSCLLQFKKGGFVALKSVQPQII